jgi:hypothetical protein
MGLLSTVQVFGFTLGMRAFHFSSPNQVSSHADGALLNAHAPSVTTDCSPEKQEGQIEEMQATIKRSQDDELKQRQGYENYLGGLDVE